MLPIIKLGDVEGLSALPFISAFTKYKSSHVEIVINQSSAVLWTKYGLVVADIPIVAVNSFGILTSLWAMAMFYRHSGADRAPQVERQVLLHLSILLVFLLAVQWDFVSQFWLSVAACASSIMMYAAPLAGLRQVLATKDTRGLSPPLVSITFLVCFTWLIYGWRAQDRFVIVPNLLGTLIAALQASLLFWCSHSRRKTSLKPSGSIYELLPVVNPPQT